MAPNNESLNPQHHILLVDDDVAVRSLLTRALTKDGYEVIATERGDKALELLDEQGFHLIITDLNMPGAGGQELLSYVRENVPGTPVIVITGYGSPHSGAEAMRLGAFDYLEKPLNLEHFGMAVKRALREAQLSHAYDYLRHEQPYVYRLERLVAESPAMRSVLKKVVQVAATDVTVLLTGETGTGKSLLAGAIHANSIRRGNTLVTVNCAALPETLLESELFGHEKGSFTGAHKNRIGRIQQAHGGTLFLDEVGDMSQATQAKVLRAIEDKVIQPVGSARSIQVDVRIIAATNVELGQAVREGLFRQDLFYRLSVAPVELPPLRSRPEDVLPLAERFRAKFCAEIKCSPKEFSHDSKDAMNAYHWPGNIRELRNAVERAVLFTAGAEIMPSDLGLAAAKSSNNDSKALPTLDLVQLERMAIETALERSDWVQARAAKLLGITPRALSYKLDKLNLDHPELLARRRR